MTKKTDKNLEEMHAGVIPGAFTPSPHGAAGMSLKSSNKMDTKKENRRHGAKPSRLRNYLQMRNAAEEEEKIEDDDLDMNTDIESEMDAEAEPKMDMDMEDEDHDYDDDGEMDSHEEDHMENDAEHEDVEARLSSLEDAIAQLRAEVDGVDMEDDMDDESDDMDDEENDDDSDFNMLDVDDLDPDYDEEDDQFDDMDSEQELNFNDEDDYEHDWNFDDEREEEQEASHLRQAIDDGFDNDDEDWDWIANINADERYGPMDDEDEFDFDPNETEEDAWARGEGGPYYPEEEEGVFDVNARDASHNSIDDDTIDQIDDITGLVKKWWREQLVGQSSTPAYAEEEEGGNKIDAARQLFQQIMNDPGITRNDIIARFVSEIDLTQSTAVSYYERIAKEFGMTNQGSGDDVADDNMMDDEVDMMGAPDEEFGTMGMDDEMDDMEDMEDRRGVIRQVDDAHLVYKRQAEDGSFEELWIYNTSKNLDDMKIRRAILAGTDIPQSRTQSEDGSQKYRLETMGNAQMLHITGLPN